MYYRNRTFFKCNFHLFNPLFVFATPLLFEGNFNITYNRQPYSINNDGFRYYYGIKSYVH